jgi:hypothetical protein
MRVRFGLVLVASFISLASVACGGAKQKGAEAPESDPWAGYQGTFAGPASGASRTASAPGASGKAGTKAKDADATKAEPEPEPEAAKPATAAAAAKKSGAKKSAAKPKTATK